jgi:hypothetical protein
VNADLRRDGRSRVPHITHGRRLHGNCCQMRKRARRSMRRLRSSWLSLVTKTPSISGFQHSLGLVMLWMGWFRFVYSGNALSTCSKWGDPKLIHHHTRTDWVVAASGKSVDAAWNSIVYSL